MRGSSYYSVIQDTIDYIGMGEYKHIHNCLTYQEAKDYLDNHPKCTHIDYFDGEEWQYEVTEEVVDNSKQ